MTTLEAFCKIMGWQGGTIHQAKERFAIASLKEQDKICGYFADNIKNISDIGQVQYFMEKRIENLRMEDLSAMHCNKQETQS